MGKLLVVDSVASLVRHEFGNSSLPSRQAELTKEAQTLKYLAETFSIPILVTNQVTTKFSEPCRDKASHQGEIPHHPAAERDAFRDGEAFLTAALGPAWSHSVNTRVVLEQTPGTASGRVLTVAKSPIAPVTTIQFEIDCGVSSSSPRQCRLMTTSGPCASTQWAQPYPTATAIRATKYLVIMQRTLSLRTSSWL